VGGRGRRPGDEPGGSVRALDPSSAASETLIEIEEFAAQVIPGADGAGSTMLEDTRVQIVVAIAEFDVEVLRLAHRPRPAERRSVNPSCRSREVAR
jgi:hypothetical protein